ncbi:thiamine pyrophosphokinase family protein [Salix suchowensis]|nr:thiamine pyrophosphokinase family protein [Salix suchowensis]
MDVMIHSSTFLLPGNDHSSSVTYALVVLNQRLPRFTPILWNHAQVRVCADGGANRLFDEMPLLFPRDDAIDVRHRYKPDIIKGDMDSIRTEVLDFYTNLGTKVVDESHDQDTTDLRKCVAYLCILVAGALGGRFDHEAGNINVLYRFSTIRIILLSDDCLIYLLPRTHHHEIHIQSSVEGPHSNTEMRFGDLVSTSNLVQGEKITVQSSSDLLWTISIKKR